MDIMPNLIVQYFIVTLLLTYTAYAELGEQKFHTHPMLYYSPDDVEGLQLKALTTHATTANLMKGAAKSMLSNQEHYLPPKEYEKFGSRWNEVYGNQLPPLAMYCVLFPDDREAVAFAIKYMDAMLNLPKWQVISIPDDEVPVAHSLTGFTTAYDMLYPVLDSTRRKSYLQKIVDETKEFFNYAKYRSWGKFYLQNHVATNYLALIHGSLVASIHYEPAVEWLTFAIEKFEKTMKLLNHIVDGSLDEGVAYGSYTSRSVTQYVFLALRHFDIDHTSSIWLKQHFWFYFNTVLPKFKRTVGIGDSNNNWFYGPESQLVFIDAYVLKNGHGNWLADEIRNNRVKERDPKELLAPAQSQAWCTLHTEFLWFDATLGKTAPSQSGKPNLHVFNDWGVVTFSRVSPKIDTDTFLAFKSGKVHGKGIFDVVQRNMYSTWVKGWHSFNPGHEHPDQNTFVFAPGGQLFITDRLYAPKYSYLNNVWSFSPSPTSECFEPWEGQLGECSKWLGWKKPSVKKYGADLVTASYNNGMVFTSGEAIEAYSGAMKLESVYRSLLLINPQMLIIMDHIETKSISPLTHFSTFFHNFLTSFESDTFGDHLSGVKIPTDAGDLRMFWITDTGSSPKANLAILPKEHTSQYQPELTNFVNITMELSRRTTRVAYVLLGHRTALTDFEFIESTRHGAKIQLKTSRQTYDVSIATNHDDPIKRHQYLGYPGFASVKLRDESVIKFGVNTTIHKDQKAGKEANSKWFNTVNLSLGFTMSACVLLYLLKGRLHLKLHRRSKVILTVILLVWLLVMAQFAINCSRSACFMFDHANAPKRSIIGLGGTSEILPSIVITALPGSGAEVIGWLFYNNPDVVYVQTPSDIIEIPPRTTFEMNPFVDACLWTYEDLGEYQQYRTWLQLLRQNLPTFIPETEPDEMNQWRRKLLKVHKDNTQEDAEVLYKEYTNRDLRDHIVKYPNAQTVLHFTSGSWGLKLPWLHSILGNNLRAIHVIRDPRSWIATFLRSNNKLFKTLNVQQAIGEMFLQADVECVSRGRYATEYDKLREHLSEVKGSSPHLLLAWLWSSNTQALLRTVTSLPESNSRLVRFEDLVGSAENTAMLIYKFIGFPLRPTMTHQLLQATHSDVYHLPYEGVISQATLTDWKHELAEYQIKDIEEICGPLMAKLGYAPMGPWRFKSQEKRHAHGA